MQRIPLQLASFALALAVVGCGSKDAPAPDSKTDVDPVSAGARAEAGERASPASEAGGAGSAAAVSGGAGAAPTAGRAARPEPGAAGKPVEAQPPPPDKDGTCDEGYAAVGGKCVCALAGTFALRQRFEVSMAGVPATEDLKDSVSYWSIVRIEASAAGELSLKLAACGYTVPEICATGYPPVAPNAEAYGQYVPASVWESEMAPSSAIKLTLVGAVPGSEFVTPAASLLTGIALADPLGAWPKKRTDIEGGPEFDGSAVNGARWVDTDEDSALGLTSIAIPPGGLPADEKNGFAESYGATSKVCPRGDSAAPRMPYAYVPASADGSRLKRYTVAQRVISEFHGRVDSCDRLSGQVTGLMGGTPLIEATFAGCTLETASATEKQCTGLQLDLLSASAGEAGVKVDSGSFALVRAEAGITCDAVRTLTFE